MSKMNSYKFKFCPIWLRYCLLDAPYFVCSIDDNETQQCFLIEVRRYYQSAARFFEQLDSVIESILKTKWRVPFLIRLFSAERDETKNSDYSLEQATKYETIAVKDSINRFKLTVNQAVNQYHYDWDLVHKNMPKPIFILWKINSKFEILVNYW